MEIGLSFGRYTLVHSLINASICTFIQLEAFQILELTALIDEVIIGVINYMVNIICSDLVYYELFALAVLQRNL